MRMALIWIVVLAASNGIVLADTASDLRRARAALDGGDFEQALHHYTGAIRWGGLSDQQLGVALENRAFAALNSGRCAVAVGDYERLLEQAADDSDSINNLAWALATCPDETVRDGARAVELARQANELSGNAYLGTLAAAHAEVAEFDQAQSVQQSFLDTLERGLARALQRVEAIRALLPQAQQQLERYQQARPWRMQTKQAAE